MSLIDVLMSIVCLFICLFVFLSSLQAVKGESTEEEEEREKEKRVQETPHVTL